MIKSAYKHGFTSESTIRFSQELDELINEFQKKNGASSRVNEEGSFPLNQMMLIWPKVLVKL
jgi:stage 0 sporulation regulatory protein